LKIENNFYFLFDFAVFPEAVSIAVISVASFNNGSNRFGKMPQLQSSIPANNKFHLPLPLLL
jgi:hypothetical protein